MYNRFMKEKELNVKVGDTVAVQGYRGTVLEVHRGIETAWNGEKYVDVPGTEYTDVKVHFTGNLFEHWAQYQDEWYGGFAVID